MSNEYSLELSAVVLRGNNSQLVRRVIVDSDSNAAIDHAMSIIDPEAGYRFGQHTITDAIPQLCAIRGTLGNRYIAAEIEAFLNECHEAAVGPQSYAPPGAARPVLTPAELSARIPYAFLEIDGD